jgi:hypothetical protein
MKLAKYLDEATALAEAFLTSINLTRNEITTGRDAWTVAHRSGIYDLTVRSDRTIVDAHVQTLLEAIFPKAIFKDKKVY